MGLEALFAFLDAPDADALSDEPFYYERGFIRFSSQPVEHKDQQDVELALLRPLLNQLELVTVIGTDLVARDAGFLLLAYDGPAHLFGKLAAGFPLHGDISVIVRIVIDLLRCGDSV